MSWADFDFDDYFANPEPEPVLTNDDSDPPVTIPPDLIDHDLVVGAQMTDALPWHFDQPDGGDTWRAIWDAVKNYIEYVVIANLDTGVNPHAMLPEPLAEESFISGQSPRDGNGHGTHTTGTHSGNDHRHGVAPGSQILVVKVLSNRGSGSSSGIAAGNRWAGDWKGSDGLTCDVVNMSLGGGSRYAPTIDAITANWSKGILTNASAGNAGRANSVGWPAKDPQCQAIAAYQQNGSIAGFSSRGPEVLVACPGQNIASADNRSRTGIRSMSGTSMSCPFKSGLDALLIALRRASGLPRWRDIQPVIDLYSHPRYVEDRGNPGDDPSFGHGVPRYGRLVDDMANWGSDLFVSLDLNQ